MARVTPICPLYISFFSTSTFVESSSPPHLYLSVYSTLSLFPLQKPVSTDWTTVTYVQLLRARIFSQIRYVIIRGNKRTDVSSTAGEIDQYVEKEEGEGTLIRTGERTDRQTPPLVASFLLFSFILTFTQKKLEDDWITNKLRLTVDARDKICFWVQPTHSRQWHPVGEASAETIKRKRGDLYLALANVRATCFYVRTLPLLPERNTFAFFLKWRQQQ